MKIDKVFPNPTVKEVNFQIEFSNLFLIENKIGDFQMEIMDVFPDSSLLIRRHVVFAETTKGIEDIQKDPDLDPTTKIWHFSSNKGYNINVTTKSVHISSTMHKSYNMGEDRFRDIIELAITNFLEVFPIRKIKRIGLRYIDNCPVFSKNNETIRKCYNTTFPLSRFNIEDAEEMSFRTVVKRGDYFLKYIELLPKGKSDVLILDFDGFTNDINAKDWLKTLDDIHLMIRREFENSIKKPIYDFMEKKGE